MDILKLPQKEIRNLHQSGLPDLSSLINSDTLFKNGDVVFILHKGEQYSLRRTRNGKLILNK
ncbi:MAG: hemin uptake protein HemP [Nitrosomonas sp.]|uniref:hemin uptake protein HemP n=1 Tax=Nitrosomonas sp. TaxID=42353 RepID=UPI00273377A3|nr:hemin uptake protein HemP [Nitrosomonas sp.]MDP1935166.1 hemin uptake protein HemP [Nitrosomonas sp.]MDP3663090.1 hemin uptake protein HemP [Nitrosomonas sp.]MDZ4106294.1 hemin uptake protein HemP [Nitrosomonas sp.]